MSLEEDMAVSAANVEAATAKLSAAEARADAARDEADAAAARIAELEAAALADAAAMVAVRDELAAMCDTNDSAMAAMAEATQRAMGFEEALAAEAADRRDDAEHSAGVCDALTKRLADAAAESADAAAAFAESLQTADDATAAAVASKADALVAQQQQLGAQHEQHVVELGLRHDAAVAAFRAEAAAALADAEEDAVDAAAVAQAHFERQLEAVAADRRRDGDVALQQCRAAQHALDAMTRAAEAMAAGTTPESPPRSSCAASPTARRDASPLLEQSPARRNTVL
jgi:hypothetical protein